MFQFDKQLVKIRRIRSFGIGWTRWLLIPTYIFCLFFQKDVMFRSAGANGTANGLYSPIANSDSSGFSEQRADLSSYR